MGDAAAASAAAAAAGRILETCQAPIHHVPGLRYIAEETPCSDNYYYYYYYYLLAVLVSFLAVLGSGSGLKMLLEVIRCILAEYRPVISILDPFQANFAI